MGVKSRIIPVLLWAEHGAVKGRGFNKDRRIGAIEDRIRLIERRDVDELILLDVSNLAPRFEEVKRLTEPLFCPVTVGGGIRNVHDIARLLRSGADKVALRSVGIVREASESFGAQAIVFSLEDRCDMEASAGLAAQVESLGAGEILLTSVERDGTMEGYDLELIHNVCDAVSIPVIAAGGCGSYEHMQQALDAGAHAVASGAMFQFCDATPKGAARYLHEHGCQVRL